MRPYRMEVMAPALCDDARDHRLETVALLKPKAFDSLPDTPRPEIFPWHDYTTLPDLKLLSLATYLERVTILFLQACNTRDQDVLRAIVDRYVAPTFVVKKAESFHSLSKQAYIRGKVDLWKESPDFLLQPRLTTAYIEESKGRALVFSTNSLTGTVNPWPELTREEVTVNHFERRKNGNWVCTKFETIRGPGHWTFEVGHAE